MKRSVTMALVVVGLVLSTGIATMAVYATSGGSDDQSAPVLKRSEPDRGQPTERSGGIGFTQEDTVMAEPPLEVSTEGGDARTNGDEAASGGEAVEGHKPGVDTAIKQTDPVEAGGLRGGVVLRDDPAQMGGAGGLCSPPHHDCYGLQDQVLAGGLRGGVVLSVDPALAGGTAR